jgi:6-phosphogluconolactonase
VTRLTVVPDGEAAARRTTDVLANHINDARRRRAEVHLALAGGSTPRRAYELLADMQGSWDHVHLWLGDERCVPAGHPEANATMVDESLLARLRAQNGPHLHRARGDLGPEDGAWLYGTELVRAMGEHPTFELVLLGLGEDGHTASLFPGHPETEVQEAPVVGVRGAPKPPPERVTLTLPVLRRARFTVLLATGAGKADALARVRAADPAVPAGRLGESLDEIVCDEAALGPAGTRSIASPPRDP